MNRRILLIAASLASSLAGQLAFGQVDQPSSVSYLDASGHQEIYTFCTKQNQPTHLYVKYWNGNTWNWADQGLPRGIGTLLPQTPAVITFADATSSQDIYAFVAGPNGHLYTNYWNGHTWAWADLGLPSGVPITNQLSAVTYRDFDGVQKIYVFAVGNNGRLYVIAWDGNRWTWYLQGPPGATRISRVSAITYWDSTGHENIYAFAQTTDGHLDVNYWNGSSWNWAVQGLPSDAAYVWAPAPIAFQDPQGNTRIYCFVSGGPSGHLYVNYWNGHTWKWADQGILPGGLSVGAPSAVTYRDTAGNQEIYAFVPLGNQHLAVNYWNGFTWNWADQGLPQGVLSLGTGPAAIAFRASGQDGTRFVNNGKELIYTFIGAGDLYVNYWNGSAWNWGDLGGL